MWLRVTKNEVLKTYKRNVISVKKISNKPGNTEFRKILINKF